MLDNGSAAGIFLIMRNEGSKSSASGGARGATTDAAFVSEHDGMAQRFVVVLPEGFENDKPRDVLIAWHGHGEGVQELTVLVMRKIRMDLPFLFRWLRGAPVVVEGGFFGLEAALEAGAVGEALAGQRQDFFPHPPFFGFGQHAGGGEV